MTNATYELGKGDGHTWLEQGEGPPLVLVHGIGGTTATWAPVLGKLSETHRTIAWSFPGYEGAAALPMEKPGAEDYANRLIDFLERRGIDRAHIVGHSLGAIVLASLVDLAPERAARLSFICPVIGAGHLPANERDTMRQGRIREIRDGGMTAFAEARTASIIGPSASESDVREIIDTMATIPEAAYLQAWEMLCSSSIESHLRSNTAPALVAGGEADPVAPPQAVNRVAAALSVTPHILPSVGHFPTHEARDALVELIET